MTNNEHTFSFNEDESLLVALLYIEDELRRSGMKLTEKQLRKTIQTAKSEIDDRSHYDADTHIIKTCLEKSLQQNDDRLVKLINRLQWENHEKSNDNEFEDDDYYDDECD